MRWRQPVLAGLLALAAGAAAGPEFDEQRLFTTAEQRAYLDQVRARLDGEVADDALWPTAAVPELPADEGTGESGDRDADGQADREAAEASEPPQPVGVRGFVSRSGGPPALWFDDEGVRGEQSGRIEGDTVVITLPDGRTVRLKPGQVFDPERGEVVDGFRR